MGVGAGVGGAAGGFLGSGVLGEISDIGHQISGTGGVARLWSRRFFGADYRGEEKGIKQSA
jgi:hypothetical protein